MSPTQLAITKKKQLSFNLSISFYLSLFSPNQSQIP